ncbi:hypothetical protein V1515DRAFT_612609 [Lipomyces mesembrius]
MDAVYGGYDPQNEPHAAWHSAVIHAEARDYESKPTGNVTEAAGKRKAVYDIPAMSLRHESYLTRNSIPSSDQSEILGWTVRGSVDMVSFIDKKIIIIVSR